jgi:hypothetical protein
MIRQGYNAQFERSGQGSPFRSNCRQPFPYRIVEGLPVILPQSGVSSANPLETWLPGLVKPDAVEQVRKTWVAAHGIKEGVYFKELQNV